MLRLLLLLICATPAWAQPFDGRVEVGAFIAEMEARHGFDANALAALFRHAESNAAVLKAIAPPADPGVRSWQDYRGRFIEPRRIAAGLRFWNENGAALRKAEAIYEVPAEIIIAIIGIETFFGQYPGRFQTFEALATLAFDYPPRADLFLRELEALLLLAREQERDPLSYRGSYAGALGLPQFLPSSVRGFAVDFDGSGRIDLAGSPADAIGSVARFLKSHGWEKDGPIALPVRVDGDVSVLIGEGIRPQRLPEEIAAFGVQANGAPRLPAALIDLATPGAPTEYRLGFNNFFVLTRYNRSSFYAAAVMDLAESLRAARPSAPPRAAGGGAVGRGLPSGSAAPVRG
ncbi:MAG: lytic murein transglycosylase B [Candidatus Nitricoxidivorans perseverans]|uniref:Lytic murein transglycosylase B n=1 Tax=Candidatus Nitricoxidivorans perseverans TaxID=2975601 RepID=A0AA49FNU3_9PROT|nr:MAG: lytic murein transglycosylase B [Candidatus Nitricoxidivorans perseverans]